MKRNIPLNYFSNPRAFGIFGFKDVVRLADIVMFLVKSSGGIGSTAEEEPLTMAGCCSIMQSLLELR